MSRASAAEFSLFRRTAIGCAVVAVGLAAFGLADLGGQTTRRAVTDGGFVAASVFAALACFRAARLPGERRLSWWLLGGAATCYAVGNTIWFYYQVLSPETQTYPGPADIFFVAVVPFAVAAMFSLAGRAVSAAARARAIADGAIVGASLLYISWIIVIGPLLEQLGEVSWLYLAVYLYYPLTDIVVISTATALAVRASGRDRLAMLLVAAGFAAIACADTGIGYLALQGEEAAGSGLDLGWTLGYMLLGLAALAPGPEEYDDEPVDQRALRRELVPYVPVALVLVVAASQAPHIADGPLGAILIAIVLLVIVRHMITLADNVRLRGRLEDLVRQRTRELEQLTRRHRSILDSAGEGIVGLDRSGWLTFANPAAAALLGRRPEELAGRPFHELTRPRGPDGEPIPHLADPVAEALADGEVRVVDDETYQRADGTHFPVELTIAPLRGRDDLTGAVVMFRDVTERRTVDRMKDEFVSVVSHELRTPLTSLRGALGLLQGDLLRDAGPKAQRMVQIAVESNDRLIRLINDILDVERIAAGKVTLHRQVWPAAELLERAVAEMRGLATQADVLLELGPTGGAVDADADRIVQTLTNLLSNAVKFSPAAGTVRLSSEERDGEVLFRVTDEGPGIPVDQREAIFGRFAQVDASDTREQEGSGLGLAICRGIVEQHGGRIWVARDDDASGTTFCFTLPAALSPTEVESPGQQVSAKSGGTVLVCEDNPTLRFVVGELLRTHGYHVLSAATGEEAIGLASRQVPDAVLMDLHLPDMDGWTAVAALHAEERTRDVPVVIVSGAEPGAPPAGIHAWLCKPLDLPLLLAAVKGAVGSDGARPRVLVVEDDLPLAQVLVAMFTERGVRAVHASDVRAAMQACRERPPDLVLLDLLLPDSDGFTLVDWLRQDPRLGRVPLVVYSALDLDEADKERLRLGPTEFLTKSRANPEQVQRQVLELLDAVVSGSNR